MKTDVSKVPTKSLHYLLSPSKQEYERYTGINVIQRWLSGHSFLPSDRVFGRIEKKTLKMDSQQYLDVFSRFGIVRKVTEEVPVNDWKLSTSSVLKLPGQLHFKFAPCKRFVIRKSNTELISVQEEEHYRSNLGVSRAILRRGTLLAQIKPYTVNIRQEKLKDVGNLLDKHFGENWGELETFAFYKGALESDNYDTLLEQEELNIFEENLELSVLVFFSFSCFTIKNVFLKFCIFRD